MNPEAKIESSLVRYVEKKLNGIAIKLCSTATTGLPDRMFLLPGGLAVLMEIKTKRGKTSKKQQYMFKRFLGRGFPVHVVHSVEEGKAILDTVVLENMEGFW